MRGDERMDGLIKDELVKDQVELGIPLERAEENARRIYRFWDAVGFGSSTLDEFAEDTDKLVGVFLASDVRNPCSIIAAFVSCLMGALVCVNRDLSELRQDVLAYIDVLMRVTEGRIKSERC